MLMFCASPLSPFSTVLVVSTSLLQKNAGPILWFPRFSEVRGTFSFWRNSGEHHQPNLRRAAQISGYQPDTQSVTTAGSSFPGPLKEVVDLDQTLAPTNATPFIKGDTRTGKKVNVRAVHKQDAGLVVAAID